MSPDFGWRYLHILGDHGHEIHLSEGFILRKPKLEIFRTILQSQRVRNNGIHLCRANSSPKQQTTKPATLFISTVVPLNIVSLGPLVPWFFLDPMIVGKLQHKHEPLGDLFLSQEKSEAARH
jgi:hypothetical protein